MFFTKKKLKTNILNLKLCTKNLNSFFFFDFIFTTQITYKHIKVNNF